MSEQAETSFNGIITNVFADIDRRIEIHKMHGNLYSSGLPDLLVVGLTGFAFIESKVSYAKVPTLNSIWRLCKPTQKRTLSCWADKGMGRPAFILASTPSGAVLVPPHLFPKPLQECADIVLKARPLRDCLIEVLAAIPGQ